MVWLAWQGDLLLGNGRILLERIERQYGKARRVWLMDRGVPTEEVLAEMRAADPPVHYLVGTPKGRLTRLERHLVAKPWQEARPGVQVKLLAQQGELYVLAQSRDRVAKERAIRRRQLKRLWARLKQLSTMEISREELLMKLGAARDQSRIAWRLAVIEVAADSATFSYRLDRNKLRQARSREGRYLLRTNLVEEDPAKLWSHYLLLVAVEEAFKNLKVDPAIRCGYRLSGLEYGKVPATYVCDRHGAGNLFSVMASPPSFSGAFADRRVGSSRVL